jgi:indole-3-glycerol phosphate synthase
VIAEIKAASPSSGILKERLEPEELAQSLARGGAVGISVLTEPKHFRGSLKTLSQTRKSVKLPILMKDIIISPRQLEAASTVGADAVLLIQALFDRGYCEHDAREMIARAHEKNLEALLEIHSKKELRSALDSQADLIGINNRDLRTLEVDLNVTRRLLEKTDCRDKVIVSESGIESPAAVRFLSRCGAQAFLVGSAIMKASNTEQKVKELVEAL